MPLATKEIRNNKNRNDDKDKRDWTAIHSIASSVFERKWETGDMTFASSTNKHNISTRL